MFFTLDNIQKYFQKYQHGRSQWPRGLRRRSAAASLLRSWVRIPPRTWMFVWCECCVLSGRGLCDELITRPEESYRLWCVVVCDLENSWMRRPWPTGGLLGQKQTKSINIGCCSKWLIEVACLIIICNILFFNCSYQKFLLSPFYVTFAVN